MENKRQNFETRSLKSTKLVCGDLVNVVDARKGASLGVVVEITDIENILNPAMHKVTGVVEILNNNEDALYGEFPGWVCVVRNHDLKGNRL